jgi:hypothetical protein
MDIFNERLYNETITAKKHNDLNMMGLQKNNHLVIPGLIFRDGVPYWHGS